MIKVKGVSVASAELEDLLLGHPQVEDCAVLGIQDEYSGEKPKAYVVPKSGAVAGRELGIELLMKYQGLQRARRVLGLDTLETQSHHPIGLINVYFCYDPIKYSATNP